jgi:hypothetical protein
MRTKLSKKQQFWISGKTVVTVSVTGTHLLEGTDVRSVEGSSVAAVQCVCDSFSCSLCSSLVVAKASEDK